MSTQPRRTSRMLLRSSQPTAEPFGDCDAAARGAADAALLIARVGAELTDLSLALNELQAALTTALAAAAAHDPAAMRQAQTLDLVTQSLQGLSVFLSGLRHRRIGREPLDFDALTATLNLSDLGARLAGRVPDGADDGFELF